LMYACACKLGFCLSYNARRLQRRRAPRRKERLLMCACSCACVVDF
jgi:hypothetical protein